MTGTMITRRRKRRRWIGGRLRRKWRPLCDESGDEEGLLSVRKWAQALLGAGAFESKTRSHFNLRVVRRTGCEGRAAAWATQVEACSGLAP